jgi:hypothetical protein
LLACVAASALKLAKSDSLVLDTTKADSEDFMGLGDKLYWVKVNDITWKLTDGTMVRTPALHGKWPGFESEQANAWAIDLGWQTGKPAWYARHGDRSCGPCTWGDAKRAAFALEVGKPLDGLKDLSGNQLKVKGRINFSQMPRAA